MDKLLGIRTEGWDGSNADALHHPYEPTPYDILQRLANSGVITKRSKLLDYGCGKGRVGFFLSFQVGCHVHGIDYDEDILKGARRNLTTANRPNKVSFELADATTYLPGDDVDAFFFFNPFPAQVLREVLGRMRASLDEHPREALIIFYYPSKEYDQLLEDTDWLELDQVIDCSDLYPRSSREKITVWKTV